MAGLHGVVHGVTAPALWAAAHASMNVGARPNELDAKRALEWLLLGDKDLPGLQSLPCFAIQAANIVYVLLFCHPNTSAFKN